jgi:hypothetical protein
MPPMMQQMAMQQQGPMGAMNMEQQWAQQQRMGGMGGGGGMEAAWAAQRNGGAMEAAWGGGGGGMEAAWQNAHPGMEQAWQDAAPGMEAAWMAAAQHKQQAQHMEAVFQEQAQMAQMEQVRVRMSDKELGTRGCESHSVQCPNPPRHLRPITHQRPSRTDRPPPPGAPWEQAWAMEQAAMEQAWVENSNQANMQAAWADNQASMEAAFSQAQVSASHSVRVTQCESFIASRSVRAALSPPGPGTRVSASHSIATAEPPLSLPPGVGERESLNCNRGAAPLTTAGRR